MMSNNNSGFNVLDMANDYAANNDIDVSELFRKHPVSGNIKKEHENEENDLTKLNESTIKEEKPNKVPWVPDKSLTEDLEDINAQPVIYDKKDIKFNMDSGILNGADESLIQESRESMDEMSRKLANIEEAKNRFGISKLQIPEGIYHVKIFTAAGDTDHKRAQEGLDEIFKEITNIHPEFILEWINDKNPDVDNNDNVESAVIENNNEKNNEENNEENIVETANEDTLNSSIETKNYDTTKVIIDKSKVSEVSWTQEDIDKIRKSRIIELNIVEEDPLEFASIEDVDDNMVDKVLMPYQRKINDIASALPASKYRATFSGLSYTEILQLFNSVEINNLDSEKKKWYICFNHIHNQSIGPWEEYKWYKDPDTKKIIKLPLSSTTPPNIQEGDLHTVTKFDDFLMKTSFMDLEFMLWKILCVTAMETELVSIDCKQIDEHGKQCNHTYDWIYSPNELLKIDTVDPVILEEMRITSELTDPNAIMKNYKSSMVCGNNTVKLISSGIRVVFGHVSAYEYLTSVYSKINDNIDENDSTTLSRVINSSILTVVKAFLIPKSDGNGFIRITGVNNLIKVINGLDEIDWKTLSEILPIVIEPYMFEFALRDIVCPKCKQRSSINIKSMSDLLFIVAQGLMSVQVTLKRT